MKKLIAVSLAAVMALSFAACGSKSGEAGSTSAASASSAAAVDENAVFVTISSAGEIVAAAEPVVPEDKNGDGAITVSDVLICTHDLFYEGGSEAGYAEIESQYGPAISKLWGVENGGSYGYYINNVAGYSLADPVKAGDYFVAYSFADLTNWTDNYSYFDQFRVENSGSVTLTLNRAGFDEEWNPIIVPVEGAVITVDGTPTEVKTDADGKATITLESGAKCISAEAPEGFTLVPPVCIVK